MSAPIRLPNLPPVPRLLNAAAAGALFAPAGGPVALARAPGRLDVMGGVADYCGSLVCQMPLAVAAAAAVQQRTDGRVVCCSRQAGATVEVPLRRLLAIAADQPQRVAAVLTGKRAWARYPIGCAWWLLARGGGRRGADGGLTILLDSDVPLGGGVSSSAAIEVATLSALCRLWGVRLPALSLAAACQEVENRVVGAPCGVMDQVASCLGRQGALLEILCQRDPKSGPAAPPAQVLGRVAVPRGYAFIGIHSGVSHEVSGDPYTDTRVAAFMAQKILAGAPCRQHGGGHLANLDPLVFGAALWLQLPREMTGRRFLRDYGPTSDPVTRVLPGRTYRVRAAAAHPIWEMQRVRRFVALLKASRAGGAQARASMVEAGVLMYNSHASYSDCANLGHPLTDRLVELVRQQGPERGFLGAKITGGGSGGTVAVLIRDHPTVRRRVESLRQAYTRQTGRPTLLFAGTSPGAAEAGMLCAPLAELTRTCRV